MVGKTIGLLLVMTVAMIMLPVQVMALVSRSHRFRASAYLSDPDTAAQFCNCMADYEASNHSH